MFLNALPRSFRYITKLTALTVVVVQLSACAPLVLGGAAATTAVVATDRRTAGEQVDDKTIGVKVSV